MQGTQWTNSTFAQICIQELPTNFDQGQFPCWACCCRASIALVVVELLLLSISSHTCIGFRGSMQQQEYSSSNLPHAIHLTYHHVFYVKPPSMSQTPKLRFHVFESISSVMNIWPRVMIVEWFKFAQRLIYSYFLLRWANLVLFLIITVITCNSLG